MLAANLLGFSNSGTSTVDLHFVELGQAVQGCTGGGEGLGCSGELADGEAVRHVDPAFSTAGTTPVIAVAVDYRAL